MDGRWNDVRRNAKDSVFVKFFEDRSNVSGCIRSFTRRIPNLRKET